MQISPRIIRTVNTTDTIWHRNNDEKRKFQKKKPVMDHERNFDEKLEFAL